MGKRRHRESAGHDATPLEHCASLDLDYEDFSIRKTSIVCTIGPATNSPEMLAALREAGMNVVRMNFSHGTHKDHRSIIDNLKKSFDLTPGRPVAVALDTKGPEIRLGIFKNGKATVVMGQKLIVTTDDARAQDGDSNTIHVDYKNLPKVVEVGRIIYIDDGLISLRVTKISDDLRSVETTVLDGGIIYNQKGVNLPKVDVDLPAVSEKDKRDLKFGAEMDVDIVFASFIRKASDIRAVQECLGEKAASIKIIAKIENHEGLRNFDEILDSCDGVMVARGDLGIEIEPEKVVLAQKMMIAKCNMVGKTVIVATQMLDSMTNNPRPTRAEVNDVASAVEDGADCVMLSGETAKGNYPRQSVKMMHRICLAAESGSFHQSHYDSIRSYVRRTSVPSVTETLASAAVEAIMQQKNIKGIIVLSTTGTTARLIAKYRPTCPIVTITRHPKTAAHLHLYRGTFSLLYPYPKDPLDSFEADVQKRLRWGFDEGKRIKMFKDGDRVILIQGYRPGAGSTNTMRILSLHGTHTSRL